VKHFTLMSSKTELLDRIARGVDEAKAWRVGHVDVCLESLATEHFAVHLSTDGLTVAEIAEAVFTAVGSA